MRGITRWAWWQKRKAEWPREGKAEKDVDKWVGGYTKSFPSFRLKRPRFLASPLACLRLSCLRVFSQSVRPVTLEQMQCFPPTWIGLPSCVLLSSGCSMFPQASPQQQVPAGPSGSPSRHLCCHPWPRSCSWELLHNMWVGRWLGVQGPHSSWEIQEAALRLSPHA